MAYNTGWIGFDLDGTLAVYNGWKGAETIGEPIAPMVELVKQFLRNGHTVKIFPARVASCLTEQQRAQARASIAAWTKQHIGTELEAVSEKDFNMIEYYDDRAIQVIFNTGVINVYNPD